MGKGGGLYGELGGVAATTGGRGGIEVGVGARKKVMGVIRGIY